jgi:hypothetical protein
MLEHITRGLYYLEVHLMYASIVWLAASSQVPISRPFWPTGSTRRLRPPACRNSRSGCPSSST